MTDLRVLAPTVDDYPLGKKDHGTGFLMDKPAPLAPQQPARGRPAHPGRGDSRLPCAPRRPRFRRRRRPDPAAPRPPKARPRCSPSSTTTPQVYLSQTGQLHMEAAAQALGRVYCFGPTFRAEKSKTRRHLTEFWMLEPEIAFAAPRRRDGPHGEPGRARRRRACSSGADPSSRPWSATWPGLEAAAATPYPRLTYDEAVAELEGTRGRDPVGRGLRRARRRTRSRPATRRPSSCTATPPR